VHVNGLEQRWTWVDKPKDVGDAPAEFHFEFSVVDVPRGRTFLVLEGSERFTIRLNGKKVAAKKSGWYLDRAMHKIALPRLKEGKNSLVLSCNYRDEMQVEDCFIIGDFGVDAATRAITTEPATLRAGDWTLQGYPHYPGGMIYRGAFDVTEKRVARALVRIGKFSGVVVAVRVNGKHAGFIPWRAADGLDVAKLVKRGRNRIEIEVMGSPKNMLGPLHHAGGKLRWTGCGEFTPTDANYTPDYVLWPWGLMDQVKIGLYTKA
jgi:hypothetical protein